VTSFLDDLRHGVLVEESFILDGRPTRSKLVLSLDCTGAHPCCWTTDR
jgi:hypothetical protein